MILALFAIAQLGTATSTAATWTDSSRHQVSFVETAPGVRLEVLDWGAPVHRFPGDHHWIFVSHADRVERLIREFLN